MSRFWSRFRGQDLPALTPSQEEINMGVRHPPGVSMSGTNEALWFAPGSDYVLGDDTWDPFKEDSDEEIELSSTARRDENEHEGQDDDARALAKAMAKHLSPLRGGDDNRTLLSGTGVSEGEKDERSVEQRIHEVQKANLELRSRKAELESELYEAGQGENSENPRQALLKKNHLREEIEKLDSEIMQNASKIDDLLAEARRKAAENAESPLSKRSTVPPKPDDGRSQSASRRSGIPRPPDEPREEKRKPAEVTELGPNDIAMMGALRRELPGQKKRLEELETEIKQLDVQLMNANNPPSESRQTAAATERQNKDGENEKKASDDNVSENRDIQPLMATTVSAIDTKDIESTRAKLAEEYNPLLADTAAKEAVLNNIHMLVENHPKVKRARKSYKRERSKFIDRIFTSIQHGKLDDVAIMTAALDMEGPADLISLDNIVQPQSQLSVIHLALITNREDIVKFLLKHSGRDLAKISVETEECENMTPLYIALQHGSFDNVRALLESVPKDDNERADYINMLVPNKAYEGMPYDELPLAGTSWSSVGKDPKEIIPMLKYLVESGADMELKTSHGNTLLHLLVLQAIESIEHISYFHGFLKHAFSKAVATWWTQRRNSQGKRKISAKDAEVRGLKYLLKVKNNDNLTPIALAAKVESPLYMDLINWENVIRYPDPKMNQQFSKVDTYDITNVTSLRPTDKGYKYDQSSVMHVLAHNSLDLSQKVWNVDISCVEPLKTIIREKWNVYQWCFYLWGFIHLVHMLAFTIITFRYEEKNVTLGKKSAAPAATNSSEDVNVSSPKTQELASGYFGPVSPGNPYFAFFLILPAVYIICEIVDLCNTRKSFEFRYSLTGNALYRILNVVFSLFTIMWFLLHMLQSVNQDIILSIALLLGWHFGIFFTRTIHFPSKTSQIGAFSIMVQRMLFHDLIPFLLISCFVLIAFSAAIHATFLHSKEASEEGITFRITFFQMLKYYSALDDGQSHESSREKEFAKAVLSIYGIISVVLLINMLIAAMNKTYDMVRETHTDLVVRQRLSILLLLERRLPFQWLRRKSEQSFDCKINQRYKNFETFLKVVSNKVISKLIKQKRRPQKR